MATRVRITERYAASIQWRGHEHIVWDAELEGFGVRVWGEGSRKGYVIQTKRDGRSFRKSLGKVVQRHATWTPDRRPIPTPLSA